MESDAQLLPSAGRFGLVLRRAELDLSIGSFLVSVIVFGPRKKKAGVVEHPEVFDHAGLLINGPPGKAGVPFI